MSGKRQKINATKILDDIAISTMTASESDLRTALTEDNIDPDSEIRNFKSIARQAVSKYQHMIYESLPDDVPENPEDAAALLERLLSFPIVQRDSFTLAFREKSSNSDKDQRVITENLLRLVKKQNNA